MEEKASANGLSGLRDEVVVGHALILCSPLRGHINPGMQLARKLTHHGFLVTFPFSEYMTNNETHLLHNHQEEKNGGKMAKIGGERENGGGEETEENKKVHIGGEDEKEGKRENGGEMLKIEGEAETEEIEERVKIGGEEEKDRERVTGGEKEKVKIGGERENGCGEEIEEEKEMDGKRENGEGLIKEEKRENGGEEVMNEGKREEKMIRRLVVADGLPKDYPREEKYQESMEALQAPVEEALLKPSVHAWPPMQCVICDVFVTWGYDLAAKLNLPYFAFFTSNATACSVLASAQDLLTKGVIPFKDEERSSEERTISIEGVIPLHPTDFPPSMQSQDPSNPRFQYTLRMFAHLHQAKALFLNTIYELEATLIDGLRRTVPVYTVGPLTSLQSATSTKDKDHHHHLLLKWLDGKPKSSVIYVSFGSLLALSEAHIREIALGLEATADEYAFIWVIRSGTLRHSLNETLPEGFMQRNKSRFLIVSWAPQLLILSHPAIAAFFSHCGWNSVLENIAMGGVPMLCLPDVAEQKINCRIIIDQWRIGVEVKRRKCDGLVTNQEIQRAIKSLLHGKEGDERRAQAALLRTQARNAIHKGGSSFTNLLSFAHSFSQT